MRKFAMPPSREDERLVASVANRLLSDLHIFRCAVCGIVRVEAGPLYQLARHERCGGRWLSVEQPLARTVLLRFLTRQMLGGGNIE